MRIALSMIVKNGMPRLEDTLRAVAPILDGYLVLDTGSKDDSPAAAKRILGGLRGAVAKEPFVDFAVSRNRALELCESACEPDWILVLDDSFVLRNAERLPRLLEGVPTDVDALGITCRLEHVTFVAHKLFRASAKIRFRYPVHEVPDLRGKKTANLPSDVWIDDPADAALGARTLDRNARDLEILERYFALHADCSRTVFYLAQTLGRLGRFEEAISRYRERMQMKSGFQAEVAEAARRIAMTTTYNLDRPWKEVYPCFVEAYELDPSRAEPLFHIAYQHYKAREIRTARLFIAQAMSLEPPAENPLGVQHRLYEIDVPELGAAIAQELGDKPLLRACLERVARTRPDHPVLALRRFLT